MKKYKFILLALLLTLLCSNGCEDRIDKYSVTIQNNSNKEMICIGMVYTSHSVHSSLLEDTSCIIVSGKFGYSNFIDDFMINPYSSRKFGMDHMVESMQTYPDPKHLYCLGVFNRIDMDTMTCEEFEQHYPLKKEWKITLADIIGAPDFNLVLEYTPDE